MNANMHPALENRPPDHMDRWTRTQRLYDHLVGLGLWVEAVYSTERRGGMEYLRVGVAPPRQLQDHG
jgi:hypothetical protein